MRVKHYFRAGRCRPMFTCMSLNTLQNSRSRTADAGDTGHARLDQAPWVVNSSLNVSERGSSWAAWSSRCWPPCRYAPAASPSCASAADPARAASSAPRHLRSRANPQPDPRITQVSTKAWYAALERAGIEDFRWHERRDAWASWHVQNGTGLFALHEMGGQESPEVVLRYAHLAAGHLAPHAERLGPCV